MTRSLSQSSTLIYYVSGWCGHVGLLNTFLVSSRFRNASVHCWLNNDNSAISQLNMLLSPTFYSIFFIKLKSISLLVLRFANGLRQIITSCRPNLLMNTLVYVSLSQNYLYLSFLSWIHKARSSIVCRLTCFNFIAQVFINRKPESLFCEILLILLSSSLLVGVSSHTRSLLWGCLVFYYVLCAHFLRGSNTDTLRRLRLCFYCALSFERASACAQRWTVRFRVPLPLGTSLLRAQWTWAIFNIIFSSTNKLASWAHCWRT